MSVIWSGLAVGAVYALVAYGYNLSWACSGVLNFANAHFVMLGTFVAAWGLTELGVPLIIAFVLCAVIGGAVGLVEELIAIAPMRSLKLRRGAGGHGELVTTVGAATVITGVAFLIWGSDPRPVRLFSDNTRVRVLGGGVRRTDLLIIAVAVVLGLAFHVWTRRGRLGLASLAQSEDRDAAMLQGINVKLLSSGGFAAAGALGGVLGPVVGAKTFAVISIALVLAIKGFVVLTLGGVGSHLGALVGGAALGLTEAMTARYMGPDYRNIAVFVLFMLVLLARPHGLLGKREARVV